VSAGVPPEILRQVKLLELRTRGLVNSLFTGEYRSVFKGQGMEFSEVREYQPGDEVRSIDWNVTARMRKPYVKRYIEDGTVSPFRTWRFNSKIPKLPEGKVLRIELMAAATIRWSTDNWATAQDSQTVENAFGIHLADLPTASLRKGSTLTFTFFWPGTGDWENVDFSVISGEQDSQ